MDSATWILLGGSGAIIAFQQLNENDGLKRVAEWLLDRAEESERDL